MRIYISIDMEGMPGTFNWEHEKTDRPAVRKCITQHVTTALLAALGSPHAAMIEEITIADSHSGGDNLDYSITELDARINLISGCPRPRYMMPELSKDYSQVWLLGYHSRHRRLAWKHGPHLFKQPHPQYLDQRPENERSPHQFRLRWL